MEEYDLNNLLMGLYLTLGFYAIARTNYFISKRNKNWGKLIHWVLHLINLVIYLYLIKWSLTLMYKIDLVKIK